MADEEVVFCSLRLLGVPGCEEDCDVFRKGRAGAPRLLLEMVHGLLSRFDKAQAAHEFLGVWPLLDKTQEKDARRAVLGWLSRLEQQGRLPPDCVRLSDLAGARGERIYWLLAALCRLALQGQLARLGRPVPRLPEPEPAAAAAAPRLLRAAALRIAAERARFLLCCARSAALLREHRAAAAEVAALAVAPPPPPKRQPGEQAAAGPAVDAAGAERLRLLWARVARLGAAPAPAALLAPPARVLASADPAAAARRYGALAARLASAAAPRTGGFAARGAAAEREGRLASLAALQARLERRLEQLAAPSAASASAAPAAVSSAARLAAAASRVAPAFDRSFSPRKKLVL